jgi:assimilatory nitrate reductase catalytic subunit
VDIHPKDALGLGLLDGSLARVYSALGEVIVRVNCTEKQSKGNLFIPIHWNDQFSAKARVGSLIPSLTDPYSSQPAFKQTPVAIEQYQPNWHGFLLSRRELQLQDLSYWTVSKGNGFFRYEIAGEESIEDWAGWARDRLCAHADDISWAEYFDKSQNNYRGARIENQKLESALFIGPSHLLPPRDYLAELFSKDNLTNDEKRSLLAGRPIGDHQDLGPVVCSCFGVRKGTIEEKIASDGLTTYQQVGECLNAGTNCGSCIPEIKGLLVGK